MSKKIYFDDEVKAQWRYAFDQARADRNRYFEWIKSEIATALQLINQFDKIYLLGGLGARLIQSTATIDTEIQEEIGSSENNDVQNQALIKDDEIEILLEHALSLALASPNNNEGKIPSLNDVDNLREQLSKIKLNVGFFESTAENPQGGNEFDAWLRLRIIEDSLHVRGDGYHVHITEVYREMFQSHDGFLKIFYGFDSKDLLRIHDRLTLYVTSKVGNSFGSMMSHRRFKEWADEKGEQTVFELMRSTGKFFIELFVDENPDLRHSNDNSAIGLIPFENISAYDRLFWVIPKTQMEAKIFQILSQPFGNNKLFNEGKFGGFPLGDTTISAKPLVTVGDKYYCFSTSLTFRNIFSITTDLIQKADAVYFEQKFRNNASPFSRDNYVEQKAKSIFKKLLPSVSFYESLEYQIEEDGMTKVPELDILGIGKDALYIIEVKAGELNKKHRRGAIVGLKQRLKDTIGEGSYQCYRAEKYIRNHSKPIFEFKKDGRSEQLIIDKSNNYKIYKISVTFDHLSSISVNLKYLIESGVLTESYKWAWIVSLYDLMIFADLIQNEDDFKEYLDHRLSLYERNDVEFNDEVDILGFFFNNEFPLGEEKTDEIIFMTSYSDDIDEYYRKRQFGFPGLEKPSKKRSL